MHLPGGMRNQVGFAIALVVGCGAHDAKAPQPQGWTGHMASADEHERRAKSHDEAAVIAESQAGPTSWSCGDVALNDQLTTGAERVTSWMPCWDVSEESAQHHRYVAAKERRAARHDRETAARLLAAERTACGGLPSRELEHSPLDHTKEIAEVVPHRESGNIRGVRIEFKPVLGLSAAWMRTAIACHQARYAALGNPGEYAPRDPTLVPGAHVAVEQHGDHVEVLVITDTEVDGKIALERGKALVAPQTAQR